MTKREKNGTTPSTRQLRPLSSAKSSDWTEVSLEVPEKEEVIHKENPQLTQIFSSNGTPTPPPRKNKKGIREKIESVARSGLQAIQGKKPVDEPPCIKKTYNYGCPADDDHKHLNRKSGEKEGANHKEEGIRSDKATKRRKNLSVVSLPNYSDLKFSLAKSEDTDALGSETRKNASSSTGKLENYMTRCRSFGSLLPQHFLDKFKTRKAPADVESDDSFGPLEDWDLRILEHYNPKDASLPRPPKPLKTEKEVLSDLESLVVSNDEVERPVPPVRRSESLLKKLNRKTSETSKVPPNVTPPPSPEVKRVEPVASPLPKAVQNEDGKTEHSNLLKILEDYSIKEQHLSNSIHEEPIPLIDEDVDEDRLVSEKPESNFSSLTPSLVEFEKTMTNAVEDFINTERSCASKDLHFTKFGGLSLPQNAAALKT